MADRWFRFYDSVVDDPKVQRLPDAAFRAWVNLMCIASKGGGFFSTDLADISFALRVSEGKARDLLQILQSAGLIERFETEWTPHNWGTRQYASDSSAERMRRHRANKVTADVQPRDEHVTSHVQNSDGADTDSEKIQNRTEKKKEEVAPVALPAWMPLETWTSFLGTRKKVTPHASKLLVSQLEKLKEGGDDPKEVLEQSIMNGWKGLFPLKRANGNGSGLRKPTATDQHLAGIASLVEDIRERRSARQG